MDKFDKIAFEDVTPEKARLLREHWQSGEGMEIQDEPGLVESAAFAAKYHYDESAQTLILQPTRMAESLNPKRVRSAIEKVLNPKPREMRAWSTGEKIYKPTPTPCGTICWVIGFITNNTEFELTASSNRTTEGSFTLKVEKIPPGNRPAAQSSDGVFQNRGSQAQRNYDRGCKGHVEYRFADYVLAIDYSLDVDISAGKIEPDYPARASASVRRYYLSAPPVKHRATCKLYRATYFECGFLYPYVTLSKI